MLRIIKDHISCFATGQLCSLRMAREVDWERPVFVLTMGATYLLVSTCPGLIPNYRPQLPLNTHYQHSAVPAKVMEF